MVMFFLVAAEGFVGILLVLVLIVVVAGSIRELTRAVAKANIMPLSAMR